MPTEYHFTTIWEFQASLEQTWKVVTDLKQYPRTWSDFPSVQLLAGDGEEVGSVWECQTRGSLPYTLTYQLEVLEVDRPQSLRTRATGDLVGVGRWAFEDMGGGRTRATYSWDVATTRPVLNLVAPLFKGLMARNHDAVMERGYRALRPLVEGVPTPS